MRKLIHTRPRRRSLFATLIVLSIALGCWQLALPRDDTLANENMRYRPCDFHFSDNYHVRCYYFKTSENGDFELPVALISAKNHDTDTARDLVVHIPGGPGQGNMTTAAELEFWVSWLDSKDFTFDLLLYDPRGTGEGKHVWDCAAYTKTSLEVLALNISAEDELVRLRESLVPCFAEFEAHLAGREPKYRDQDQDQDQDQHQDDDTLSRDPLSIDTFATVHQAQDLRDLIDTLGYARVHLWGVSYGTRVALAAADHPQVISLLLDSPYPFDKGDFSEWPHLYHRSFALHQELMAHYMPEERASFVDIYRRAEQRLAIAPVDFYADHWDSGETIPFVLNDRRLLELSFGVLYNNTLYERYLRGLHAYATSGEVTEELRFLIEHFVTSAFDKGFNTMVYFATECADNRPMSKATVAEAIRYYPNMADYFSLLWSHDVCQLSDFSDDTFVQGLQYPDKPTLIFSGAYDPVTPSVWGEELANTLNQARHVEIAGVGHGALFDIDCDWSFFENFLHTQDLDLDIQCQSSTSWP